MTRWRDRLARRLLRHAGAVMPASREEWVRAMMAEGEHLGDRDRLSFAIGCLWSCYRERLLDRATMLAAGRWSVMLGLGAAAAVCVRTGASLRGDPADLVLLLGLVCIVAALAFLHWGIRRLPIIAMAGFATGLLAMALTADTDILIGGTAPAVRFYRAILIEQLAGWAALFGLAHVLLTVDRGSRADG